jgi:Tol biopolymer transport system component
MTHGHGRSVTRSVVGDKGSKRRLLRQSIALAAVSAVLALGLVTGGGPTQANASALNGQIVFTYDDDSGRVFVANPDGTHMSQIPLEDPADCPSWSPDGSKVLVCTFRPEELVRPATVGPDGSGFTLLDNPDPDLGIFCTSWSPDGARLACEGNTDPYSSIEGIYTVAADGSDLTRLTQNPYGIASCCPFRSGDGVPSYSPDGSRIVFSRFNQKGQSAIFTMNAADGSGVFQVTPWGLGGGGGRWSPDGQWIAFGLRDFHTPSWVRRGELYLVRPDGTDLQKIAIDTHGSQYFAKQPTWSPDGTRILFVMYLGSNGWQPDLFTMNPDGSHLTQVTNTPDPENVPSWGTHPPAA